MMRFEFVHNLINLTIYNHWQNWDFYMEKAHSLRKQLTQQSNSWKSHLGGFSERI